MPVSQIEPNDDVLKYAFGYSPKKEKEKEKELFRTSQHYADIQFVEWLCKLSLHRISGYGYGYLELKGTISEIFICNPGNMIELTFYEYRYVSYYQKQAVIETYNG